MYITFNRQPKLVQPAFEDLYENLYNNRPVQVRIEDDLQHTVTRIATNFDSNEMYRRYALGNMKNAIVSAGIKAEQMLKDDMSEYYDTFYIPKHSGGMRRIDAPKYELMNTLRQFKDMFERSLHVLYHDAAYAYVPKRSTVDAVRVHQRNESKWFLKLDIKDFFPSCNHDFIMRQLEQIFPFAILFETELIKNYMSSIIKLCLLDDKLPQGTPMSPMLTNLIMIPIDYSINETFKNFDNQVFKYTRYADDILISCKYDFHWRSVETEVRRIFNNHGTIFVIKQEKTRYGSSAGRNWNLGLMLNKDNEITIGHQKKQRLKATIFSFLKDFTNNNRWNIIDTQVMVGNISYYHKIEPEYIRYLTEKYNQKFGVNFKECVKSILNGDLTGTYPPMVY